MNRLLRLLGLVLLTTGLGAATASAADVPTLTASKSQVAFGGAVTLRGAVPASAAGQDVELLSQACGFTEPVSVASTTSAADGSFSFSLEPTLSTTFLVQVGDTQSATSKVSVQPLVQLRKMSPRTFQVSVSVGAGQFFTKKALVQRYDTHRRAWRTVASAPLKQASDVGALIAVSAASVHATIAHGSKVRAYIPAATLGQCYGPAASAATSV